MQALIRELTRVERPALESERGQPFRRSVRAAGRALRARPQTRKSVA